MSVSIAERDARDEDVLALLQRNDPNAGRRLVDVFGDRIYGLSLRILASEEEARDAVQETFLTIWRKWPTFKGQAKFSSWVYRVAANQAYMRLRKDIRRPAEVSLDQLWFRDGSDAGERGLDETLAGDSRPPDEEMQRHELQDLLEKAVASLSPLYRTAYMLKEIDGMSLKEIAEVMNLTEPAVKSRVHRARLAVRRKLQPYLC